VGREATVTRSPDEQDFVQHLETVHHIPATTLAALFRQALADVHEAEHTKHAKSLWVSGPSSR